MKKILTVCVATLCCTAMMFNSCKKPVNPPTPETKVYGEMKFKVTVSDEILSRFDATVKYYDVDGTVKSEKMTASTFEKDVKADLPCKLGVHVSLQVKDGQDVNTMSAFTGAVGYDYKAYCIDDKGYVSTNVAGEQDYQEHSFKEGKVAEWYNDYKDDLINILYDYKADQTLSKTSW